MAEDMNKTDEFQIIAKEVKIVPEGRHDAVISRMERRTEPFDYLDIYFKLADTETEVKYGVPFNLSEKSKLGKLLAELGTKLEIGEEYDIKTMLTGKEVSVMTITEEDSGFSRIVDGSIKKR